MMLQILDEEFKKGESATIQNLGRFYCSEGKYIDDETKIFKFPPVAKLDQFWVGTKLIEEKFKLCC